MTAPVKSVIISKKATCKNLMTLIVFLFIVFILAASLVYIVRRQQQKLALPPALYTLVLGLALTGGLVVFVVQQGSQLPDATLTNFAQQDTELADYLDGRPLVVNLWASWCPPCVREMPMLENAEQRHQDVRFIFINQREHLDLVRQFLQQHELSLETVLLDSSGDFSAMVGAHVMPTTLFFSADGTLQKRYFGEVDDAVLSDGLQRIRD